MGYIRINVEESVHIDLKEVWDEIDENDFELEMKKRGYETKDKDFDLKKYICDKHGLSYSTDIEILKRLLIEEL